MGETPVRLGIVGCGGMGTGHAQRAGERDAEVVAGADVVEDARAAFAETFDAEAFEDHESMYDGVDLDAVVVTTPNAFHEPAVVAALDRDIHVLCEKPLAADLAAAERIAAADDDSDAFCLVGFHNRFSTAADLFTAYRDEGRFGDIIHVEANYVRRRGIPGLGSWFTTKDLSGGGALIDIGVHAIDFAMYLAGFPEIEEVSGATRTAFGDRDDYADPDGFGGMWSSEDDVFDVDDSASAFVRFADGSTMSLEVAWAANREPTNSFVVDGSDGGAEMSLGGESIRLFECGTAGTDHYADTQLAGDRSLVGHEAELKAFIEGVREGTRPALNTVGEGLAVQQLIDAIYRSSEAGSAVEV